MKLKEFIQNNKKKLIIGSGSIAMVGVLVLGVVFLQPTENKDSNVKVVKTLDKDKKEKEKTTNAIKDDKKQEELKQEEKKDTEKKEETKTTSDTSTTTNTRTNTTDTTTSKKATSTTTNKSNTTTTTTTKKNEPIKQVEPKKTEEKKEKTFKEDFEDKTLKPMKVGEYRIETIGDMKYAIIQVENGLTKMYRYGLGNSGKAFNSFDEALVWGSNNIDTSKYSNYEVGECFYNGKVVHTVEFFNY